MRGLWVNADGAVLLTGSGAFVARLSPDLQDLQISIVFSGEGGAHGTAIRAAPEGIYVAGYRRHEDTESTAGIVARLDASAAEVQAVAALGGSGSTSIDGLTLDASGRVLVHGSTTAYDFPATGVYSQPCGPDFGQANAAQFLTRLDRRLETVEKSVLLTGVSSLGLPPGAGPVDLHFRPWPGAGGTGGV